ncbi:hypothetical protein ABFS83_13G079200 [Erythranthe nasuta]
MVLPEDFGVGDSILYRKDRIDQVVTSASSLGSYSKSKRNRHGSDRHVTTARKLCRGRDDKSRGEEYRRRKRSRYNNRSTRNLNVTAVDELLLSPWDIVIPPPAVIRASGPSVRSSGSKPSGDSSHVDSFFSKVPSLDEDESFSDEDESFSSENMKI